MIIGGPVLILSLTSEEAARLGFLAMRAMKPAPGEDPCATSLRKKINAAAALAIDYLRAGQ